MNVLARIPELPQTAQPDQPVDAQESLPPQPTSGLRRPTRLFDRSSIALLAVIAAAIWSVVLWQERDRPAERSGELRIADGRDGSSAVEHAR
jgi:hypothetical protein